MKITVSEALRLKNELSSAFRTLQMTSHSCGETFEDGVLVSAEGEITFAAYIERMETFFQLSEELNGALAKYNVNSGISDAVRRKANIEVLVDLYDGALRQATATKRSRREMRGETIATVATEFKPFMAKGEIKAALKVLKAQKRRLLEKIEKSNAQEIELSFDYDAVEELVS